MQSNHQNNDLSLTKQCELLGVSRSSVYYESKVVDENNLSGLIHKIWSDDQSKGYRMITADLRMYHNQIINSKRVRRIMS